MIRILCLSALLFFPSLALSHPMAHSEIELIIDGAKITARLTIPMADYQEATGLILKGKSIAEIREQEKAVSEYILAHVDLLDDSGLPWRKKQIGPIDARDLDKRLPDLLSKIEFEPPAHCSEQCLDHIKLRSDLVIEKVVTHKIFVSLKSDWEQGIFSEDKNILNILRYQYYEIDIRREQVSFWRGPWGIFKLGLRHIVEGLDHLIFLFMLVLPIFLHRQQQRWTNFSSLHHGVWKMVALVSSFTIGHSLTLILSSTELIQIPVPITETLVAVTVLLTSIHSIRPILPSREWIISMFFGFVHGFAFSEVMIELQLKSWKLFVSILSFNLGVEITQLVLLMSVTPLLYLLSRWRYFYTIRIATALVGCALSFAWIMGARP